MLIHVRRPASTFNIAGERKLADCNLLLFAELTSRSDSPRSWHSPEFAQPFWTQSNGDLDARWLNGGTVRNRSSASGGVCNPGLDPTSSGR